MLGRVIISEGVFFSPFLPLETGKTKRRFFFGFFVREEPTIFAPRTYINIHSGVILFGKGAMDTYQKGWISL